MIGRPIATEPRNTAANATVVAIGWMKYAKVLPLTRPTAVRTVRPNVASMRIAGIFVPRTTRRRIAAYAQISTAAIAAGTLIVFTITKNMTAGMTVASIRFGNSAPCHCAEQRTVPASRDVHRVTVEACAVHEHPRCRPHGCRPHRCRPHGDGLAHMGNRSAPGRRTTCRRAGCTSRVAESGSVLPAMIF